MNFDPFDIFMILFTVLIFFGVVRAAQHKNKFALGFGVVALLIFLLTDMVMVLNWFGALESVLAMVGL